MSTRPRCRARPSIEAPSAGSTISGNRVTMSIFIWFAVGAPAPGRLTQARLDRPQGRLACGCASASGLPLVADRVPHHARGHALEALGPIGEGNHPDLPAQAVRPHDLADGDELLPTQRSREPPASSAWSRWR